MPDQAQASLQQYVLVSCCCFWDKIQVKLSSLQAVKHKDFSTEDRLSAGFEMAQACGFACNLQQWTYLPGVGSLQLICPCSNMPSATCRDQGLSPCSIPTAGTCAQACRCWWGPLSVKPLYSLGDSYQASRLEVARLLQRRQVLRLDQHVLELHLCQQEVLSSTLCPRTWLSSC